jgi:hypothetical protein
MTTVHQPPPPVKPPARKPARPPHGTARLTLAINGTCYGVHPVSAHAFAALKVYRLRKADGTAYHVSQQAYGCECECGDFVFHRAGLDQAGCKHVKALIAVGLLSE